MGNDSIVGNVELSLPPLGFGAFKIGRNVGTKYASPYDLPDDRAVDRLLNGILDEGISYIDTAPAYGLSEERIGRFIGHRRNEYTLSTKAGETFVDGVSTYDFSEQAVRASIARSLTRLRTDFLDAAFIHANRDDLAILTGTDVVPTLMALKDDGSVGAIGLSGYTPQAFCASFAWCDVLMATYHPQDVSLQEVIAEAGARGIPVVVKKGLASGAVPASHAIPFVLENRNVSSMVVGSLNLDHLRENLRLARQIRPDGWKSQVPPSGERGVVGPGRTPGTRT